MLAVEEEAVTVPLEEGNEGKNAGKRTNQSSVSLSSTKQAATDAAAKKATKVSTVAPNALNAVNALNALDALKSLKSLKSPTAPTVPRVQEKVLVARLVPVGVGLTNERHSYRNGATRITSVLGPNQDATVVENDAAMRFKQQYQLDHSLNVHPTLIPTTVRTVHHPTDISDNVRHAMVREIRSMHVGGYSWCTFPTTL